MKAVESEGSSVEEAIRRARILLGLGESEIEVEILREASEETGETAIIRALPRGGNAEPAPKKKAPAPQPRTPEEPRPRLEETPDAGRADLDDDPDEEPKDDPETEPLAASNDDVSGETSRPTARSIREQEDRAVAFMDRMLELLDADCAVGVMPAAPDGRITLELTGPDTGLMIGSKAQTLDAAEFLLNRALDHQEPGGPRVSLDAEGYRGRREAKLREMARQEAAQVRRDQEAIELEPMSPRDRRTIHMALADDDEVDTHSEGEGIDRHVVIEPSDW